MNNGIVVQLNVDKKTRIKNILKEYKAAGKENFIAALQKLIDRLSQSVITEMKLLLNAENYAGFIEKMLDYYDNTSKYQLEKKEGIVLDVEARNGADTTQQLLELLMKTNIIIV